MCGEGCLECGDSEVRERCGGDRLDGLGWAAIFFWGALVLITEFSGFAGRFAWWEGWSVFFTGAGILVLGEAMIRLMVPRWRRLFLWNLIGGAVLLGIGLGSVVGWEWIAVAGLGIVGMVILHGTFTRK
ncbi:MAG: hypothetical protein ACYTHM_03080 [Planctomycetota bacterium]|jgi:hypothetical protein